MAPLSKAGSEAVRCSNPAQAAPARLGTDGAGDDDVDVANQR